jgi:hypothetical protein
MRFGSNKAAIVLDLIQAWLRFVCYCHVLLLQVPMLTFTEPTPKGHRRLVQPEHHHPLVAVETRLLHVHEEDKARPDG